jgi:hypothetical protein
VRKVIQITKDQERYSRTQSVLQNPLVVHAHSDSAALFRNPTLKAGSKEELTCQELHATIVDFYKPDMGVHFLRRSPSVYDIIYKDKDSPGMIMSKARRNLKELVVNLMINPTKKQESDNGLDVGLESDSNEEYSRAYDSTVQFRWIHLPANNVSNISLHRIMY